MANSQHPIRILQIIGAIATRYGGPAKVIQEMSETLAGRGHQVDLLTTDADWGKNLSDPLGVPTTTNGYRRFVYHCEWPRPPHISLGFPSGVRQLCRTADVAHVHGIFSFPTAAACLTLSRTQVPYVVRPCGALDKHGLERRGIVKQLYMMALERSYLNRAIFIQASTERERDQIAAWNLTAPVEVIPQGVSSPRHNNGPRCLAHPYILCLGRIAKKKGIDLAIQSLKSLMTDMPDIHLVIAGSDERNHRAELERLASSEGVSDRVVFVGLVEGEVKARWLRDAEALVLPSLDENFGVVVVESALVGTPIVVSPQVALSVELEHDSAGIVAQRDSNAVAEAIRAVIKTGKGNWVDGCLKFASRYDWETSAVRLERAYAEGIKRFKERAACK